MAKKKDPLKVAVDTKPVLATLAAVLAIVAVWFLFTGPARSDAGDAATKRAQAEQVLADHQDELARLKDGGQTQARQALEQAKRLDAALPERVNKVEFVADISNLAARRGVTIDKMEPAAVTAENGTTGSAADGSGPAAFSAALSGSGGALTTFLADLTSSNPLMTVQDVKLNASGEGDETTLTFTLNVWSMNGTKPLR